MSSPMSSLKKMHKLPLAGQRPIPFRDPHYSDNERAGYFLFQQVIHNWFIKGCDDESKLLDEITTDMATSRIKERDPFFGGLPKLSVRQNSILTCQSTAAVPVKNTPAPSDNELMTLMVNRVAMLEQRLQYQNKEMSEKDKRIRILEDKLQIMQKAQASGSPSRTNELEKKCLLLQQQVHEMESFLSDYGMVWVGEKISDASVYNDDSLNSDDDDEAEVWRPASSVSKSHEFHIDFNRLIDNIQDLNTLAGEGVAKIQHTTDGARLKIPDPVPLTLYANGMLLFSGPFRSYNEPLTQQCLQDLLDGYFPSELQGRYPDGIPFVVTDHRKVTFQAKSPSVFAGAGQMLGGDTKPSRLVPTNLDKSTQLQQDESGTKISDSVSSGEVTSQLPGKQMTVEQFLEKLPKSVMKQGRLIDIRSSVEDNMKGGGKTNVTVCDTQVTTEMKKRLEDKTAKIRPSTPRNITTLRIKSESGNHTYIVKMKFHETIHDLRKYLDKQRSKMPPYKITSAYPKRTYDDENATLEECELVPNAALLLRPGI